MRLKARLQRLAQQATKKRRYDYAAGQEKQRQHISQAAGLWMRGEYSLASGLAAHRHAIVRLHQQDGERRTEADHHSSASPSRSEATATPQGASPAPALSRSQPLAKNSAEASKPWRTVLRSRPENTQ